MLYASYIIIFISTFRWPALSAGLLLGGHGLVSTVSFEYDLSFKIWVYGVLFFALFLRNILRIQGAKGLTVDSENLEFLTFATLFLCIGVVGELIRNYSYSPASLSLSFSNLLDSIPHSVKIITRWLPYFFISFLAVRLGNNLVFLKFFIAGFLGQFLLLNDHVLSQLNYYVENGSWQGLNLVGLNRVFVGFEAALCLGVSLFLFLRADLKKTWIAYFLSIILVLFIALSNSKGPFIAGLCVLSIYGILSFKEGYAKVVAILLLIAISMSATFAIQKKNVPNHIKDTSNQSQVDGRQVDVRQVDVRKSIVEAMSIGFRVPESVSIRWHILQTAAYPDKYDVSKWMFGAGFGGSRYYKDRDGELVFLEMGTHVLWVDLLLDVGILGALLLLLIMLRLVKTYPVKSPLLMAIILVFGIKSLVASDTYSEPILMLILGVLAAKNPSNLEVAKG